MLQTIWKNNLVKGSLEWWIWAQCSTSFDQDDMQTLPGVLSAWLQLTICEPIYYQKKKKKCVCVHVCMCVYCIGFVVQRTLTDNGKPKSAMLRTVFTFQLIRCYFSSDITGNTSRHWPKVSWGLRRTKPLDAFNSKLMQFFKIFF